MTQIFEHMFKKWTKKVAEVTHMHTHTIIKNGDWEILNKQQTADN